MNLHENKPYFEAALNSCSEASRVSKAIIEKDYYVTLFLNEISHLQQSVPVFFKGGTALYKALKSIRRFSEDIDLTVRIDDCPTNNQAKKRLELSSVKFKSLPRDKENEANINKKGTITAIYSYKTCLPKLDRDELQRFELLKVEATSFTVSEPTQILEVEPILYTLSLPAIRDELSKYNVKPFNIETVAIERIFADKILAAVYYSEREEFFDVAKHAYDLCIMMQMPQIQSLLQDTDGFIKILSYKRMEENVRLGSNLDTKPLNRLGFFDNLTNPSFCEKFKSMQSLYVFNTNDRISLADLFDSLSPLKNYLCAISEKEQGYLDSLEYRIEKCKLLCQTQDFDPVKNPHSKNIKL